MKEYASSHLTSIRTRALQASAGWCLLSCPGFVLVNFVIPRRATLKLFTRLASAASSVKP
eukprot:43428-Pelagomonas_calceolata.AAC.1